MKVIFLDVDGVLNDRHTLEREPTTGYIGVDETKCQLLSEIVQKTGCRIVLSSTWRKHPKMLPYLYQKLGPVVHGSIVGQTPVLDELTAASTLYRGHTRGDEIAAWLKGTDSAYHFLILDDDPCMGELREHCLQTDTHIGLTPQLAEQAIERLNRL